MQQVSVGLIGGSGYTGMETTRLLAAHPAVSLQLVASDQWKGRSLADTLAVRGAAAALEYLPLADAVARARECKVVVLATPAAAALERVPALLAAGVKCIDLSGAFRLRDAALYPASYGFSHGQTALLKESVYGLPELCPPASASTRLVANPGCYATAVALAIAPLLARKAIVPEDVIADAGSGITGAGRKATEELSFSEAADDVRAYKVLSHQHAPEIAQTVTAAAGGVPINLTFTPHLLPLRRGILATVHAKLRPGVSAADVGGILQSAYEGRPFVRVLESAEQVSLRDVVHTARCNLGLTTDGRRVVVTSALDNLLKGAASQAVQNLNAMLGLPEDEGLRHLLDTPA